MIDGKNSAIVKVAFDGDEIEVVRIDEKAFVIIKRLTHPLGLEFGSQLKRLKSSPWAGVVMIAIPDQRGRLQVQACLPLDSVPMYLATVNARKVASKVRPKLVRYQLYAHGVLRDAFFGPPVPKALALDFDHVKGELAYIHNRLEIHPSFSGRISDSEHAKDMIRATARGVADALEIGVPKVYGMIRKEYKTSSPFNLTFDCGSHVMEWLRAQAKDTRVVKIARQLSLWPTGGE